MLVARMASCHVVNAFSTRLKLIWPKSSLKMAKMSRKTCFFAKSSGSQWVNNIFNKFCAVMQDTGCHIHFPDSNRGTTNEKSNQVGYYYC